MQIDLCMIPAAGRVNCGWAPPAARDIGGARPRHRTLSLVNLYLYRSIYLSISVHIYLSI